MQEKWNELQALLEEMKTMKKREYFLILAVCVLGGLVAGMLISPRKNVMIASNNGNTRGNAGRKGQGECEGCEEDCCDDGYGYDWED